MPEESATLWEVAGEGEVAEEGQGREGHLLNAANRQAHHRLWPRDRRPDSAEAGFRPPVCPKEQGVRGDGVAGEQGASEMPRRGGEGGTRGNHALAGAVAYRFFEKAG